MFCIHRSVFGYLMTLRFFNLKQDSDEDEADVHIAGCVLQQYQTSICVRVVLNSLFR